VTLIFGQGDIGGILKGPPWYFLHDQHRHMILLITAHPF